MQNWLSIILIVVVAVLLGWASQRFTVTADWTYANRASLTPASQRVVAALDAGPIRFTAFVYPGAMRDTIRGRLGRYLRADDDISLEFVDPARHPRKMRQLGISESGAVRVYYQGRSEILSQLSEPAVTRALQRLSVAREQWIVFLTGHGERDITSDAPGGYSELAAALDAQGLKAREISLAETAAIPDNAAVVVIASPRSELLPGEIAMIRDYVALGGNLLWLDDPGPRYGLSALAADLDIVWQPGTLVYPDYRKLGTGHPAMALVVNYPPTPITERINRLTLYPFAGGLEATDDSGWRSRTILRTPARSWLETQPLDRGTLTFAPDEGDRSGPITLGLALSRPAPAAATTDDQRGERQRVVVVADSDFVTNEYIDTLGNRQIGMALFQWLAHRDAQIAVDVTGAPDATLQLAPGTTRSLWYVFVFLLPLGLLVVGIGRWAVRRRR